MATQSAPNYAGLIYWRRSRATGTQVGVYNGEQADMDTDGGACPWTTVCEDHGGVCSHPTRALAIAHAPYPNEWCPKCQEESEDPATPARPDPDTTGRSW